MDHIDANYRTIAGREHRGITGLSMGGFMSFWIGGKYPHLVSAAGSFCGSAEFEVGPKDFPVEYRHLDMYNNYGGMNDGEGGDRIASDLLFSHKIPDQTFGIFHVIVEAEDSFGNRSVLEAEDRFVFH